MIDSESLPHMKELDAFAEKIRERYPNGHVPNFDPKDGGKNADMLFLFEKPGPKAAKSGFISQDNDDASACATKCFLKKAGIDRKRIVLWNTIPAWNGSVKITGDEMQHALEVAKTAFPDLLNILCKLRAIVFVGKKAEKLATEFELTERYKVTFSMHPSAVNAGTNWEKWKQIPEIWKSAIPEE